MEFNAVPTSLEVSRDASIVTIAHGNCVSFWNAERYYYCYYLNNFYNLFYLLSYFQFIKS